MKNLQETRAYDAPPKEVELTTKYQPIIAEDCFDKFFDETKELGSKESELKNDLKNLFKRALGYQTASPEALALVATVDEIKSQEDLSQIFSHIDLENLKLIDRIWLGNKNNISPSFNLEFDGRELSSATGENLQSYIDGTGFSGSMVVSQGNKTYESHSENVETNTSFATHSVGKLFTGVLTIEALRQGILEEDQLHQPVKLEQSVLDKLPENVREHLKTTTLHQLMTHKSGLGDYLDNYIGTIESILKSGEESPKINGPEDFLKFTDDSIKIPPFVNKRGELMETRYSNLGSLLVGLAVQNAYNEKHPDDQLAYGQILQRYVLEPAGVANFSAERPENGCTNPQDLVAPHIAGSPAGGYWTDAESLNNFGSWLCDKWQEPEFQRLTKEYGQEFYYPESKMLGHGGSIESSCAYLQAFVETGIVYAGLSNQPINTHVIASNIESRVVSHYEKLAAEEKDGEKSLVKNLEPTGQKNIPSPNELATIFETNSSSSEIDKAKEGWIMSVSKTFCGATAALMAADEKFGENKMNATLLDVLNEAEKNHPDRSGVIGQYRDMVLKKECGSVTMSQLLSHRSGLTQGDDYFTPGKLSNLEVYNNSEILNFKESKRGNVFSYCNPGFILAEDMMNLVSDSDKGYYEELENRIIKPLGLKHTKSIYESEESKKAASEIVKIEGVVYDWGVKSKDTIRLNPLETNQKGRIALSEGGLCSSVGDLETFYGELSKLACGIPNLLQKDSTKTGEIHGFYLDAYEAGKECKSDSQRELSMHCAKQYSLGVIIDIDMTDKDKDGKPIKPTPSQGNENKASIRFGHIGNQPGNDAAVSATMPFSFAKFTSRTVDLEELNASISQNGVLINASISQKDVLAKDSLLTIVSCNYIAKMDEYFSGKCDKIEDQTYNDKWRAYNQYWEAARTGKDVAQAWQADLIEWGRLPTNFGTFHDEIRAAYAPAEEALAAYVRENFCNEGVINSEKVKAGLRTAEDFKEVQKAIEPFLQEAQEKTEKIFTRSDEQLREESESFVKKIKPSKAIAANFREVFADKMQSDDGRSFVEKLELKKTDEKPRSFVEAAQDGDIEGKGGAREL